jgi:NADP-dependent 3-hydroxy acid dehydrogenase YdfG
MLKKINKDFGQIDLLINNADKSDNILIKVYVDKYRKIFGTENS